MLGYVNKEFVSVTGAERYFDFYLRGQDGWRESERDGKRQELAQYREREVPARDGLNLQLSINQMVQYFAEEEIARLAEQYKPEGISIWYPSPVQGRFWPWLIIRPMTRMNFTTRKNTRSLISAIVH